MDAVGRYEGAIKEYIQSITQEDVRGLHSSFKENPDPFTEWASKIGKTKKPRRGAASQ